MVMKLEYPGVVGSGSIYLDVLRAICGDTSGKSMVDLGCFHAPYTPQLGFSERWYVDVQDRGLDFKDEQQYFIPEDMVFFLKTGDRIYDVLISSDSLEHLIFEKAYDFIRLMQQKSRKQIIFTPLGPLYNSNDPHPDSHKSWWWTGDFPDWAHIVFPSFHPRLNCGAFFTWNTSDLQKDFERVKTELNNKPWTKKIG